MNERDEDEKKKGERELTGGSGVDSSFYSPDRVSFFFAPANAGKEE